MNSDDKAQLAETTDENVDRDFADIAKPENAQKPPVEAYDPHFGRQAMTKDAFWHL